MKLDFDILEKKLKSLDKEIEKSLDLATKPTPAAVLIPIYEKNDEHYLLFTKRSDNLRHHKGQISFPGGKYEKHDESLEKTAIRETYEEIGIKETDVTIIGKSLKMITNTNFLVTPVVGTFNYPYDFKINTEETSYLIEVPLKHLVDRKNFSVGEKEFFGEKHTIYSYTFQEHVIWGVTGKIIFDFFELVGL